MQRASAAALALSLSLLCAAAPAPAQQARPGERPPERTIYVPIEDFDRVFDREKGGVFVPYRELLELLERAGKKPTPEVKPEVRPPAEFVLVGAKLTGLAGERVVRFEATFDIEVLEADRWVIVPLGLGEASLEDVRTGDARAVVGPMAQLAAELARREPGRRPDALPRAGYGLVVKGAGRLQTTARFAVPIASKPGESRFDLTLPPAALSSFEVTLPQSGLRVAVDQALATEEASVAGADQTKVRAYFGAAAKAAVTWNPRPKEVVGERRDPLVFADTETSIRLDEGVLQTTTRIAYRILQAPCGEFKLELPKGYTLLGIRGENMSAVPVPEPTRDGKAQQVTVRLHDKAKDAYALEVRLERILADGPGALDVPRVVTVGTEREGGLIAARASEFLTLEPQAVQGLSQVDASAITGPLAQDVKWQPGQPRPPLVFRYLRQPWALTLKTTRIEPEVDGKVFGLALVKDDEVALATTVRYTIRKRGIFGVRLRLPQGYQLLECGDERTVKDRRTVDATPEEKAKGLGDVLVVDFVNQVQPGNFSLTILGVLRRTPAAPDATELEPLDLPRLGLLDVQKETGVLAVGAQTHLKLQQDGSARGLLPLAVRDLPAQGFAFAAGQGEELTFGYRYGKPDGVGARFLVKKREPKVTARVETLVDAQEEQIKVDSTVHFTVEYAGVEQVRFRVPEALGTEELLKIEGDGVKDRRVEKKDGKAIWTVSLQGKRTGSFAVRLRHEMLLQGFQPGQQVDKKLHELEVLDCFTETGDIALVKHENLVITDRDRVAIDRRDTRELPDALRQKGAIQAFRYVSHPHELTLQLTRYDFQAPLGILIKHLHQDEVVARDVGRRGASDRTLTLKVEAALVLQNNAAQFLTVLLPAGAQMRGLQVDGKNEEWSTGEAVEGRPTVQVHLGEVTKARRDAPFPVRLRYDVPMGDDLSGLGSVSIPDLRFPLKGELEVPVARLTRALWLPQDLAYLDFETDATKHFDDATLWEDLKGLLGVRVTRIQGGDARWSVEQAVEALRASLPSASVGLYPALERPPERPRLLEKLANPSRLTVRYASWPLFYLLDVLALVGVVAGGVLLERRGAVRTLPYVFAAGGLCVLGATFLGRAFEPYFASGLVGAAGLGGFALLRGAWRELTVERHQRRLEELAEEAKVARARAQAAEAEARSRGLAPTPGAAADAAPKGADPKGAAPTEAERRAADAIRLAPDPAAAPSTKAPQGGADAGQAGPGDAPAGGEDEGAGGA